MASLRLWSAVEVLPLPLPITGNASPGGPGGGLWFGWIKLSLNEAGQGGRRLKAMLVSRL